MSILEQEPALEQVDSREVSGKWPEHEHVYCGMTACVRKKESIENGGKITYRYSSHGTTVMSE